MEKARELDPKNPATWNNLANYYGHFGEVTQAFAYYSKAIELNPNEPIYYQNFGTTVFLFRKDATEFYQINEQQVFDKALDLYAQARKLAPEDFALATDVAQTYYGIRPWRFEAALGAWTNALNVAGNEVEREGVYIHMARIEIQAHRWAQATNHLNAVTNAAYASLKDKVAKSIEFWKTNAVVITNYSALGQNSVVPEPKNK
jgi:tetratricopeptide (TPR) repeat protein